MRGRERGVRSGAEREYIPGPIWSGVEGCCRGTIGVTLRGPVKVALLWKETEEGEAEGWKPLWEAVAESALRCWLRQAATCTLLRGMCAGGKRWLIQEVGSYTTKKKKSLG